MGLSLSMCSTNSFIDFARLLEYLIHFEMIIMYGERNRPILIFFVLKYPDFPVPFIEEIF